LQADQQPSGVEQYWEGQHNGYRHLKAPVRYRRALIGLPQDTWLVVDYLESKHDHAYRLHWLLADLPYQWDQQQKHLQLATPAGEYHLQLGSLLAQGKASLCRADSENPHSPNLFLDIVWPATVPSSYCQQSLGNPLRRVVSKINMVIFTKQVFT
jgi:hypothetical protein